ncbi:MAG: amino acid--[acyl-carrier-protein] ligase [Pseudomonadota bacterium]
MTTEITYDSTSLYDALVAAKLIIPTSVKGVFGRGAVFEDVLFHLNAAVSKLAKDDGAEVMLFPPTLDRKVFEKSGYLKSFPHLAGVVFSFCGNEAQHQDLTCCLAEGKPWGHTQTMTDVVLTPAACYPVYPSFTGTVPAEGRLVDMQNWVFRHEPSPEPTRMQAFRIREFVRVGTPQMVIEWRDMWLKRGIGLLRDLGLPAESDVASDPFFGRGGRMLAANQKAASLKFEVLVPVISKENPTACCSFNYHEDHFGHSFEIKTQDGNTAHTACLGFGLERICMGLFKHHGCDPKTWPVDVRHLLWG